MEVTTTTDLDTIRYGEVFTNASSAFASLKLEDSKLHDLVIKAIRRASIEGSLVAPLELTHWFAWDRFFLLGPSGIIWQVDTTSESPVKRVEINFQSRNSVEVYRYFLGGETQSHQFKVLRDEDYLPITFSKTKTIGDEEWGYYTHYSKAKALSSASDPKHLCRPVGMQLLDPKYFSKDLPQTYNTRSIWTPESHNEFESWLPLCNCEFLPTLETGLLEQPSKKEPTFKTFLQHARNSLNH